MQARMRQWLIVAAVSVGVTLGGWAIVIATGGSRPHLVVLGVAGGLGVVAARLLYDIVQYLDATGVRGITAQRHTFVRHVRSSVERTHLLAVLFGLLVGGGIELLAQHIW